MYLFFFYISIIIAIAFIKKIMKTSISIIFIILFSPIFLLGQSDSTFKSSLNDSILNKIYSHIPKGWTITEKGNQIVFQRNDSIFSLEEYRFDTKYMTETKAEKNEKIITNGKKIVSKLVLRYETRWSYSKTLTTKNNNALYSQKLQKLPEKYKITSLYNKKLSTKLNSVYTGITDKEKDAVKKYEKERVEILSKIITLPMYNTEKYSFFIVSMEGYNNDNHYIIPEAASSEFFKILTLFFEFSAN